MGEKVKRKRRTQVPGQYLGYLLQQTRFLQLLLQASPGSVVSLEVFEDVGVQSPGQAGLASQVKSALATNPIADRAVEFWKALRNWIDAIRDGQLCADSTVFEIYVSSPKRGGIAERFAGAASVADAIAALAEARQTLWGDAPTYQRQNELPAELREHCAIVLDPKNSSVPVLVKSFQLTMGSGDPLGDAKHMMASPIMPEETVELAFCHALGWVKERVDTLIQQKRPAFVSYDDFTAEMRSFVRKVDLSRILMSFAGKPTREAVEADQMRTYVKQLELINVDHEDKIQAINDCLRAEIDRTHWSAKGIVNRSSFDEFEEGLTKYWHNKKQQASIVHKTLDPSDRGNVLYRDCMLLRLPLEGLEVPPHFTPGSFHSMADDEKVGWHEDFKALLQHLRRE